MLLSPPFLPELEPSDTDEQFLDRAMPDRPPGDGTFPVSPYLYFHGGIHLQSPPGPHVRGGTLSLPARAIADGTVAFLREPTPVSSDPNHPLRYRDAWTDDGCVIIRHETDIGANATTGSATTVVFFSIYMHLSMLSNRLVKGQPVFRKDPIGGAGSMYGEQHKIHFEIICDDVNVERLAGRRTLENSLAADGRADAVYGAMWFHLPSGTEFFADEPQAGQPLPPVSGRSTEPLFIRRELSFGAALTQSFRADGSTVGVELIDTEFEYELYKTASEKFPNCPAAGYELLRFGRLIGPDALNPPNAAHYWEVQYESDHTSWVNLNGPDVKRFSDADFPHWDGWKLVDASASPDSRCPQTRARDLGLSDANHDGVVSPDEVTAALNDAERRKKLGRKIVKHRSEWDGADFDARYKWILDERRAKPAEYAQLKAHVAKLAFWDAAGLGIDAVHWHFHPRAFIEQFKKCGWLAVDEFAQLIPRLPFGAHRPRDAIPFAKAQARSRRYNLQLNSTLRRYNLLTLRRQAHFLAQTYIECALWATMNEYKQGAPIRGPTHPSRFYAAFYGRGSMQLTWPRNFESYGKFRSFGPLAGTNYLDPRITATSVHYFEDPVNRSTGLMNPAIAQHRWYPRYDPAVVADDDFNACDSGGFFWVSKHLFGAFNINRIADNLFNTTSVATCCWLINGGTNGFDERQCWAKYVFRYMSDTSDASATETFTAKQYGRHGAVHSITVDYTPQRP